MRTLPTDHAGLEVLHLGDCFRLLESVPVGRVGFFTNGEVVILPVNYLVDGQDVVFRSVDGTKLASLPSGHLVGFEADAYSVVTRTGWSVVISGFAEVVDSDEEIERLEALGLDSWGTPAQDRSWMRIRPMSITGRRTPGSGL